MEKKKAKREARSLRIYEYTDQHGVVFWSFTLLSPHATRRLNYADVRGTHYRTFISDVHQMAFQREILEEEE